MTAAMLMNSLAHPANISVCSGLVVITANMQHDRQAGKQKKGRWRKKRFTADEEILLRLKNRPVLHANISSELSVASLANKACWTIISSSDMGFLMRLFRLKALKRKWSKKNDEKTKKSCDPHKTKQKTVTYFNHRLYILLRDQH